MYWTMVIERNGGALRRIVAMLVAMARLGEPGEGFPTLPRHRHRAILRLLRPAESAARRLIIVAAQGLVVILPPFRPRRPRPKPLAPVLRGLGIAVVTSGVTASRAAAGAQDKNRAAAGAQSRDRAAAGAQNENRAAAGARKPVLPLIDPLKSFAPRRRTVPAHAAPRIMRLDLEAPHHPLPAPPSRDDPLDATALTRRLRALGAALDDLPGQAKRFAKWQARNLADRAAAGAQNRGFDAAGAQKKNRDAAGAQIKSRTRNWPLRPGRAPGQIKAERRRQEVHDVLADLHYFACEVLASRDTS